MAPQKFADLGKEARDLINKNFHNGLFKIEANHASENGMKFKTEGSHNTENGDVAASLETKCTIAPYGIAVTKKWHTDNILTSTIGIQDKLVPGLKVDLDTNVAIATSKTAMKLKTAYAHEMIHATVDMDVAASPTFNVSGVAAYQGVHAGVQAAIGENFKLQSNNFGLAYKAGDLIINAGMSGAKYTGSIHHSVNKDLTAAAAVDYSADGGTSLTLCAKYATDEHTSIKAKLDNNLRFGTAYVQTLRPGVTLTGSGLINLKALDQGGHKVGIMLNFDA